MLKFPWRKSMELENHHVKWNKSDYERQILSCVLSYAKYRPRGKKDTIVKCGGTTWWWELGREGRNEVEEAKYDWNTSYTCMKIE
jgi:hypothetical protein